MPALYNSLILGVVKLYNTSECQQIKVARGVVLNKLTIKGSTTVLYNIKGLAEIKVLLSKVQEYRKSWKSQNDQPPEIAEISKVLQQNMLYFLYDNIGGTIYVGEAGQRAVESDARTRIGEHLIPGNDYYYGRWNEIQFVVSDRDDITQDIMDKVEAMLICMAFDQENLQSESYEVLNSKKEQINNIPAYYKSSDAYCFTIISDIQNMLSDIGCDVFKDVQQETAVERLLKKIQMQLDKESRQKNVTAGNTVSKDDQRYTVNKPFRSIVEKVCEVQTPKKLIEAQLQLIDWDNVDEHTTFLNIACKDGGYIKALMYKLFEVEKAKGCFKELREYQDNQIIMNILSNQLFGLVTSEKAVVPSRLGAYYFEDIGLASSINNIIHIPYFSDSLIKGDIVLWLDKLNEFDRDYCKGFYTRFKDAASLAQWAIDEDLKQSNKQPILQTEMRKEMFNVFQAVLTKSQRKEDIVKAILQDSGFQGMYINRTKLSSQEKKHNDKVVALYKKVKKQVLVDTVVKDVLRKEFGIMDFDIVIGNPPYQDGEKGNVQIYQYFIESSLDIAKVGVNMVTNSHWFGRDTMKSTRDRMIKAGITDIIDYPKIGDMFKTVQVPVAIFNINKTIHPKNTRYSKYIEDKLVDKQLMTLNVGDIVCTGVADQIVQKINADNFQSMSKQVIPWSGFGIETNLTIKGAVQGEKTPIEMSEDMSDEFDIGLQYLTGRTLQKAYIRRRDVQRRQDLIPMYKVCFGRILHKTRNVVTNIHVFGPNEVTSRQFGIFAVYDNFDEANAVQRYAKTRFFRYLCTLKIGAGTNGWSPMYFDYVPNQDFTRNSDINWAKSIYEIERQLYKKYNLQEKEIECIESSLDSYE